MTYSPKKAPSEELTLDQLNDLFVTPRSVRGNSGLYGGGTNGLRLLTGGGDTNANRDIAYPIGTGTVRAPQLNYHSNPNSLSARTFQAGLSLAGEAAAPVGYGGNVGFGIVKDDLGNYALYRTGGGGLAAGTPHGRIAAQVAVSNAKTVHDLEGQGYFTSLGGGFGPHVSVDGFTGKALDGKTVIGGGGTFGLGAGGGSVTGASGTYISPSINIRDLPKMPTTSDIIEYFNSKNKRR